MTLNEPDPIINITVNKQGNRRQDEERGPSFFLVSLSILPSYPLVACSNTYQYQDTSWQVSGDAGRHLRLFVLLLSLELRPYYIVRLPKLQLSDLLIHVCFWLMLLKYLLELHRLPCLPILG